MAGNQNNGAIVYTVVSGKTQVSAFNGPTRQEIADMANKVLQQVDMTFDTKKSYSSKGLTFNYVARNRTVVLCVADEMFPRRICFAYLDYVTDTVVDKGKATRGQLESDMRHYSSSSDVDKIRAVQKQVDDVKGIMLENIEKVLERGEKLEDLDAKTQALEAQSHTFQKTSKKLKCELCKKNLKLTIIIIVLCVVLLAVIVGVCVHFFK